MINALYLICQKENTTLYLTGYEKKNCQKKLIIDRLGTHLKSEKKKK